jgi:Uma2 family endonuclease
MTIARTFGLGLGLVLLVGVGAATLSRGQQAGEKSTTPATKRGELRERIVTLRTEIDLLQVECDAARGRLVEAIKQADEEERNFWFPAADAQDAARRSLKELKGAVKKGQSLLDSKEVTEIISEVREKVGKETAQRLKTLLEEGKEEAFALLLLDLEVSETEHAESTENNQRRKAEVERFLASRKAVTCKKQSFLMMSTQTQTAIPTAPPAGARPATASGLVPYRLTARQFEKMIDAGIFHDEDHVELLGGLLVDQMVKNPPHNVAVGKSATNLRTLLPAGWFVREEKSVRLGRWSHPEPDLSVVRGVEDDYAQRDPTARDVGLIGEVSDSTYAKDRGSKWRKYATAKIPVYWIVNLPQRQIEVFSTPSGRGKTAGYRDCQVYGEGDEVPVVLDGRERGRIKVRDVLPQQKTP